MGARSYGHQDRLWLKSGDPGFGLGHVEVQSQRHCPTTEFHSEGALPTEEGEHQVPGVKSLKRAYLVPSHKAL